MDAKAKQEQLELLSTIDSILAALERQKKIDFDLNLQANVSPNAFAFLLDIIKRFATTTDIVNWLVNILTVNLPAIELAVKGVLLANIKSSISCTLDPTIPSKMRRKPKAKAQEIDCGFVFHPKNIDYNNIFYYNPMSEEGASLYFGTTTYYTIDGSDKKYYTYQHALNTLYELNKDEIKNDASLMLSLPEKIMKNGKVKNFYELSRAEDFNAFLWFVGVKCKFLKVKTEKPQNLEGNLLGVIRETNSKVQIGTGDVIKSNNDFYSICLHGYENANEDGYDLEIVPFSCQKNGANWYVNRGTYFNFLLPEKERKPRDYDEEFAICNISYEKSYSNTAPIIYPHGSMRFTILPSPSVWKDTNIQNGLTLPKRLLFDKDGNPTSKGKYSIDIESANKKTEDGKENYYWGNDWKLVIDGGKYELKRLDDNALVSDILYECYPGLTIYEFNYDYIMGMQLFDPKVLTLTIMNAAFNVFNGLDKIGGINASAKVNKTESAYQMRIAEIVKKIVTEETSTVSDCFFTFSNDEFDALLQKAELKRSQNYQFTDNENHKVSTDMSNVYDILRSYDDNATLQENQDVLTRAITTATANITNEVLPSDQYSVELKLLTDMVNSLTISLVETILSPKIMLLFELNRRYVTDVKDMFAFSDEYFEEILKSMVNVIVSIVREIRDHILSLLLDWVVVIIQDLASKLADLIIKEQLEFYTQLLKRLLNACKFSFPLFGHRKLLDSQLDMVTYAEIDEIDMPIKNNC